MFALTAGLKRSSAGGDGEDCPVFKCSDMHYIYSIYSICVHQIWLMYAWVVLSVCVCAVRLLPVNVAAEADMAFLGSADT